MFKSGLVIFSIVKVIWRSIDLAYEEYWSFVGLQSVLVKSLSVLSYGGIQWDEHITPGSRQAALIQSNYLFCSWDVQTQVTGHHSRNPRIGPNPLGLVHLHGEEEIRGVHRGKAMWGHGKKVAIYKPATQPCQNANSAGPLCLCFQPLRLWEINVYCGRYLGHSVLLWQPKWTKKMCQMLTKLLKPPSRAGVGVIS